MYYIILALQGIAGSQFHRNKIGGSSLLQYILNTVGVSEDEIVEKLSRKYDSCCNTF